MAAIGSLVSPGISVTVTDESFYISAGSVTTPLIFVATMSEKMQPDGLTPALGTYEHNVVRRINSLSQSIATYGTPFFGDSDPSGVVRYHGDCRNEYGLLALNRFLGIGSGAYVVRAGINLNDDRDTLNQMWDDLMTNSLTGANQPPLGVSVVLNGRIEEYMTNYNLDNEITNIADPRLKTSINAAEFLEIVTVLLQDMLGVKQSGTQLWFDNDTFASTRPTFFEDRTANPLNIYTNQNFAIAPVGTYIGVTGNIAALDGATSPGHNLISSFDGSTGTNIEPTDPIYVKFISSAVSSPVLSSQIVRVDGSGWTGVLPGDKVVVTRAENIVNNGTYVVVSLETDVVANDSLVVSLLPDVVTDAWAASPLDSAPFDDSMDNSALVEVYRAALTGFWTPAQAQAFYDTWAIEYLNTREFVNATTLGGTDAQRRLKIASALAAATRIEDLLSETLEYNIILCPGFPEVDDEMISLSISIGEEAFVIGETPFNLNPDELVTWTDTNKRTNPNGVIGYYYPHGLTSNVDGMEVFTTAASSALRVITYNDKNANIWDAPAGTQRGVVSDITSTGYITGTLGTEAATYVTVALNQGQRDALYQKNINPIVAFPNRGIIVWGQKSSTLVSSALDRINVAREVMYIRRKVRQNAMPFVFQPNDQITRDQVKAMVDSFLGNIMANRGLYDFLVICDEGNNTAFVLDNNSLVCDILIKPTKTAEFFYFPIKVLSSGATLG